MNASPLGVSLGRTCWTVESVAGDLALTDLASGRLPHVRECRFEHVGSASELGPPDQPVRSYADTSSELAAFEGDDWSVTISSHGGKWFAATVLAASAELADRLIGDVRARRRPPRDPEHILPIDFSYECNGGARRVRRRLSVPAWADIAGNYTAPVRAAIEPLMAMGPPDADGRLLLWHGPPGTGKTTAIRALMRSWREWCKPLFIVDPDQLFQTASYLLGAIVDDHSLADDEWRLLVIEDADELLRADAKARSGQALSRLLNLSDGLIGQGLRVLLMLTTNEPLADLHPAVVRPGRCISQVRFGPLTAAEAAEWLGRPPEGAADGHADRRDGVAGFTLAELYEAVRHGPATSGRTDGAAV